MGLLYLFIHPRVTFVFVVQLTLTLYSIKQRNAHLLN
jgi:hypothetical protein